LIGASRDALFSRTLPQAGKYNNTVLFGELALSKYYVKNNVYQNSLKIIEISTKNLNPPGCLMGSIVFRAAMNIFQCLFRKPSLQRPQCLASIVMTAVTCFSLPSVVQPEAYSQSRRVQRSNLQWVGYTSVLQWVG